MRGAPTRVSGVLGIYRDFLKIYREFLSHPRIRGKISRIRSKFLCARHDIVLVQDMFCFDGSAKTGCI